VVLPRPAAEQRSKNNNDRDAAREGTTRGTKRPLSPNPGESSSKAAALSPNQGKVAPMKQRKSLSTLGGRKVSTSVEADKGSKKSPSLGLLKLLLLLLLPRGGLSEQLGSNHSIALIPQILLVTVKLITLNAAAFVRVVPSPSPVLRRMILQHMKM
jgi:hypothetical protein